MPPISLSVRFICPLGLALFTAGCGMPANQGNDLLGGACLSGLSGLAPNTTLPHQSASLTGFDRSGFPRETVIVPMASVETFPTYATPAMGGRDQDASRPFPTAPTALQRNMESTSDLSDALAAPFVAAIDLAISPVRMFCTPPWTIQLEPAGDFDLLPGNRPISDVAPPAAHSPDQSQPETSDEPETEHAPETPTSAGSSVSSEPVTPRADTLEREADATGNE